MIDRTETTATVISPDTVVEIKFGRLMELMREFTRVSKEAHALTGKLQRIVLDATAVGDRDRGEL